MKNLDAMLSESPQQQQKAAAAAAASDDDVFNNNAQQKQQPQQQVNKVSKFTKRRTKIGSSDDELDAPKSDTPMAVKPSVDPNTKTTTNKETTQQRPVISTKSNEKTLTKERPNLPPKVPSKPNRLPSTGGVGLSPGSPDLKSPGPHSPRFNAASRASPVAKTPPPIPKKSPEAKSSVSAGNVSNSSNSSSSSSNSSSSTSIKTPPLVSPKPRSGSSSSNNSRTLYIANKPNVAPKPLRKSSPLSVEGKMALVSDLKERKRSSSLNAMLDDAPTGTTEELTPLKQEASKSNSNIISAAVPGNAAENAELSQITYPLAILRKKPVRTEALKSCSDLMDVVGDTGSVVNSTVDLESLSGESSASEYIARDSLFESDMMKKYKKSQHFLIEQSSLPDYGQSESASRSDSVTSVDVKTNDDQNTALSQKTSTENAGVVKYSKNAASKSPKTKEKVGLKRSNAKRTKTPPSSPTVNKLAQHKSYDPHVMKQLKIKPSMGPLSRHSDVFTNSDAFAEDSDDDDSDYENEYEAIWNYRTAPRDKHNQQETNLDELDLNFDFPPIQTLPNPRLEMRFDSPFDLIRRFLAHNRGPNEIFPVPRKSERGGKAISKLKLILSRLGPA